MRTLLLLRNGCALSVAVALGVAACGAEDGNKKVPPGGYESGGDGGALSAAGATWEAGASNTALGGAGGSSGDGGSSASGAGAGASLSGAAGSDGGTGAGGESGVGGVGGVGEECVVEQPSTECPPGTASCDDDPSDCETDVATDASNCGRCERACGGTATCSQGFCGATVILDPNVSSNWCSAVFSATTAYALTCWGNNDLSEVRSAPIEPGASVIGTSIRAYNNVSVVAMRGLLIDGDQVLFGLQESPSHLYKFPLNATGPADVSIAYTFENNQRFDDLKLIGDTFWWNHNTHTAAGTVQPSTIEKRAKAEESSTVVVSGLGLSYNVQVFDSSLLWLEQRTQQSTVSVYRAPIAGALVADTELVAVAAAGAYMKRQGDYVYWTHKQAAPNGMVRRFKADDPDAEVEDVATGLNLPEGLATDSKYAYFKQLDALYRVPLCGGSPEQLSPVVPAHDSQATNVFHVDEKYVYLAAGPGFGASTLVRIAK